MANDLRDTGAVLGPNKPLKPETASPEAVPDTPPDGPPDGIEAGGGSPPKGSPITDQPVAVSSPSGKSAPPTGKARSLANLGRGNDHVQKSIERREKREAAKRTAEAEAVQAKLASLETVGGVDALLREIAADESVAPPYRVQALNALKRSDEAPDCQRPCCVERAMPTSVLEWLLGQEEPEVCPYCNRRMSDGTLGPPHTL